MLNRILLLLALLAPLPAAAQDRNTFDPQEEEEGTICLTYATRWLGVSADIRDIERIPVPDGFRQEFESTALCKHLQPESLIDWHLAFGTEASGVAALTYLERAYTKDAPGLDRYVEQLEDAWRAAQRDLRRAHKIEQLEGLSYSVRWRFIGQSKTIQRLRALGYDSYGSYRFLAEQYLKVAEEYHSLMLLEIAQRYIGAVQTGAEMLASFEDREPLKGLFTFDLDTFRTDALEMRAAVLHAKLTHTPEAIAHAEAIVQGKERPYYRRLADRAFSRGSDFCDISNGTGPSEALKDTCEAADTAHEEVVNFMLARAMLDLVVDEGDPLGWRSNASVALRLLEAERHFESSRCCGALTADEILLRLRLALADYHRRQYQELEVDSAVPDALDQLREAERLVTPFDSPARFGRIARDWLELYRKWEAIQAAEGDDPRPRDPRPRDARYAAYLEQTLADLDAIAQGGN